MRTDQRLTKAYENARLEFIDEKSNYIIFSDCHRGNGGHWDEFTKNNNIFLYALEYYYKRNFIYVEAGDGDELWENRKFQYIRKAHADVFSVIKQFYDDGRFIMLYGNHNNYLADLNYVQRNFSKYYHEYTEMEYEFLPGIKPCEALVLKINDTGQKIFIVHGHQGDFANDQFWFFSMISLKYFWKYVHSLGIKNPASPVINVYKRHKIEKNFNKWIEKHQIMLICGHTHRYKYPRMHELPYFNAGCCVYPTSITGIEITESKIQLVRWRTKFDNNGILHVTREIFRGPDYLAKFDIK